MAQEVANRLRTASQFGPRLPGHQAPPFLKSAPSQSAP
jgi:hypothetical protein